LRYSTLNILYHPDVLNLWRSQGCFPTIAKKLGYRLRMIRTTAPVTAVAGNSYNISITLRNTGYAAPYNPRGFEIILRSHATGALYRPVLASVPDPRRWLPDLKAFTLDISMTLPLDLPSGSYDVLLNLPDPAPLLYGRPEYSIRLANKKVWESSTGFNDLRYDLHVANAG